MVDTMGTGTLPDEEISKLISREFDLRPKGIIEMLDLLRPIYKKTAAYVIFEEMNQSLAGKVQIKKIT